MTRPRIAFVLALLIATTLLTGTLGMSASEIMLSERKSDYWMMGPQTRAMQDDDLTNPGMLWVLDGEALWQRKDGAGQILRRLPRRRPH